MTSTDSVRASRAVPFVTTRHLALCGVLAPLAFTLSTVVLGALRPEYSHVESVVSMLAAQGAPYAAVQRVAFVGSGLLLVALATGLHRGVADDERSPWGPALLALAGLGWAGAGVFQIATGPTGAADWGATTSLFHEATAGVFFYGAIVGMYVCSRRFRNAPDWADYGRYSKWASGVALAIMIFYGATGSDGAGLFPDGVLQRLYLAWVGLWVLVVGVHLYRTAR
jgi:hypothetical membrane protein